MLFVKSSKSFHFRFISTEITSLCESSKEPKSFFFVSAIHKQYESDNKIDRLTVSHFFIVHWKSLENIHKSLLSDVSILIFCKEWMIWKRSIKIFHNVVQPLRFIAFSQQFLVKTLRWLKFSLSRNFPGKPSILWWRTLRQSIHE